MVWRVRRVDGDGGRAEFVDSNMQNETVAKGLLLSDMCPGPLTLKILSIQWKYKNDLAQILLEKMSEKN